jgi:hypothetical protein
MADFNFEVYPEYLLATEDSLYLVKDVSFGDVHRIIIFSLKNLLGFIAKGDYWMIAGTFKVSFFVCFFFN